MTSQRTASVIVWLSALLPLLIYPVVIFGHSIIGVSWYRMLPWHWNPSPYYAAATVTYVFPGSFVLIFLLTTFCAKRYFSKTMFFTLLGVAIVSNLAFLASEIVLWLLVFGD